jgi:CheY-like chemotaxis protein
VTAESAECGLQGLRKQAFEMVISDLELPDMGCRELLERIRSHFSGRTLGIVSGKEAVKGPFPSREALALERSILSAIPRETPNGAGQSHSL